MPKLLRAQRLLAAQGGDCLFVYAVEDGQLIVWVLAAGNRRDVSPSDGVAPRSLRRSPYRTLWDPTGTYGT
jgi:hypothetical protein